MFLHQPKVKVWSRFYWEIKTEKDENGWRVSAYATIPLFDNALQKIRLKKIVFATVSLSFAGEYRYNNVQQALMEKYVYNQYRNPQYLENLINEEISTRLSSFILASPSADIAWIREKDLPESNVESRIHLYAFFLKHPHLKSYDFFYWKVFDRFREISQTCYTVEKMLSYILNFRNEKSVKKACYTAYEASMKKFSYYDPTADYHFSRQIDDCNFLQRLIGMDVTVKSKLFNEITWQEIEHFFHFLKKHYTQKAITAFFLNMRADNYLRDTIRMFRGEMGNFIQEHFEKVPLRIERLHDAFIRTARLHNEVILSKKVFGYHENDLAAQTTREGLEYRLPANALILQRWSQELHNCMYGYSNAIYQSRSIIYGVFQEEHLRYAVEIRDNKIVQALGKYNKRIETEDRALIDIWFKEVYVKSWLKPIG